MIVSWHIIVRRSVKLSAFHPAFKWRGNHHALLQLRRSSILRAGATRRIMKRSVKYIITAASHGCIRLPKGMAEHFFNASAEGTQVIVKE
jgi:hypothetical protein